MLGRSLVLIGIVVLLALLCPVVNAQPIEHVVQKGELAVKIAKDYGISLDRLQQLNPGWNLAKLQIGDKLVVGEKAEQSKSVSTADTADGHDGRPDKVALMNKEKEAQAAASQSPGVVKSVIMMIFKLGVVLGLAYFTVLALKALSERRDASPRIRRDLKVVDTVRLSNTSSLHLVDVAGRTLLLGCSSGQVNLLQELDPPEQAEVEPVTESRFADYLAKYSGAGSRNTAAVRVAGLLKDCAKYLQERKRRTAAGRGQGSGDNNEA